MTVLILAPDDDADVDAVVRILNREDIPVFRLSHYQLMYELVVEAGLKKEGWEGIVDLHSEWVDITNVCSVWNRYPPAMITNTGVGGILSTQYTAWMNRPWHCGEMVYGLQHWEVARECGLFVPELVLTTQPNIAIHMADNDGWDKTITRPITWTGLPGEELSREELSVLAENVQTPQLIQLCAPRTHHVRVAVLGDIRYPVAVHEFDGPPIRQQGNRPNVLHEPVSIPVQVLVSLREYLRRTGLVIAEVTFAVNDLDWTLLDVNPVPPLLDLESATGAPIIRTVADLLTASDIVQEQRAEAAARNLFRLQHRRAG